MMPQSLRLTRLQSIPTTYHSAQCGCQHSLSLLLGLQQLPVSFVAVPGPTARHAQAHSAGWRPLQTQLQQKRMPAATPDPEDQPTSFSAIPGLQRLQVSSFSMLRPSVFAGILLLALMQSWSGFLTALFCPYADSANLCGGFKPPFNFLKISEFSSNLFCLAFMWPQIINSYICKWGPHIKMIPSASCLGVGT